MKNKLLLILFASLLCSSISNGQYYITSQTWPSYTDSGSFCNYPRIYVTTNAYTSQLLKDVEVKPARAQVLITAPIEGLKMKGAFHYNKGYYYFRNVGQRVLFGGGRNLDFEGETTTELETTDKIQSVLEKMLSEKIIPGLQYKVEHRWSGIMGLGEGDKSPIVKNISPRVHCAVRLGGMGVAIGTLVGQEAAAMVLKQL